MKPMSTQLPQDFSAATHSEPLPTAASETPKKPRLQLDFDQSLATEISLKPYTEYNPKHMNQSLKLVRHEQTSKPGKALMKTLYQPTTSPFHSSQQMAASGAGLLASQLAVVQKAHENEYPFEPMTLDRFMSALPSLSREKAQLYLPFCNEAMERFGISTPRRQAMFLAQIAVETSDLQHLSERGGKDKKYFDRYEPGHLSPDGKNVAKILGNTEPGDGYKYRGQGPFQLTGRWNFTIESERLGIDLVNQPELAGTPECGFLVAASFWARHRGNRLADEGDVKKVTHFVNAGARRKDIQNRAAAYERICKTWGVNEPPKEEPGEVFTEICDAPMTKANSGP